MSYTRLVPGHRWTRITLGAVLLLGLIAPINCTSDPIVAPQPPSPTIPPNGLLVVVGTTFYGSGWPSTFPMHVDNGDNISIPANGSLVIPGLTPGTHEVWIKTPRGGGSFCLAGAWPGTPDGWYGKSMTMIAGGTARMDFAFTCIP